MEFIDGRVIEDPNILRTLEELRCKAFPKEKGNIKMEEQKKCKDRVREHYQGRIEDLTKLWNLYKKDPDGYDDELGNWNEYGLGFDYVSPGTFSGQRRGYWRYQLSWGGPSDEFRFYADENLKLTHIEYWFMDWFDGAKINVTREEFDLLSEIWGDLKETGTVEHTRKEAMAA